MATKGRHLVDETPTEPRPAGRGRAGVDRRATHRPRCRSPARIGTPVGV